MPYDSEGFLAPAIAKPTTTADILDAAADLISQPGRWTDRGRVMRRPDGKLAYCMVGAINAVSYEALNPYEHPAVLSAVRLLGLKDYEQLWAINDSQGQHAAIAALRKAAKLARESEG